MGAPSIQHLMQFVEYNKLLRTDGVILFQARITMAKPSRPGFSISEIQVLRLPEEVVLYVIDLSQVDPLVNEMYRSNVHDFDLLEANILSITDSENDRIVHFATL